MNTNTTFNGFDDLGDDFGAMEVADIPTVEDASRNKSQQKVVGLIVETCFKCNGSGRWYSYSSLGHNQCTKCKGTGKLTFKNDKKTREQNRERAAARKEAKAQEAFIAFGQKHPRIAAWWNETTFDFAVSLRNACLKYGTLTPNQEAAAYRQIERFEQAKAERAERAEQAKTDANVSTASVEQAISRAMGNGIKTPKLRLAYGDCGEMVIYRAKEHSVNAGSLYVKSTNDEYLGKITNGVFYRARGVEKDEEQAIVEAMQNPLESAVLFGRRTGACSCCGRELTNGVSIDKGIGPICESKFFA